jgi:hypothetical protein
MRSSVSMHRLLDEQADQDHDGQSGKHFVGLELIRGA